MIAVEEEEALDDADGHAEDEDLQQEEKEGGGREDAPERRARRLRGRGAPRVVRYRHRERDDEREIASTEHNEIRPEAAVRVHVAHEQRAAAPAQGPPEPEPAVGARGAAADAVERVGVEDAPRREELHEERHREDAGEVAADEPLPREQEQRARAERRRRQVDALRRAVDVRDAGPARRRDDADQGHQALDRADLHRAQALVVVKHLPEAAPGRRRQRREQEEEAQQAERSRLCGRLRGLGLLVHRLLKAARAQLGRGHRRSIDAAAPS